ncbi:CocE/NonD family hydrolase [Acetobacter nitrogenifigens]|nr:CocE/NonD family hydrolase [Acetobacter nitrogenifigens]
MTARLARSRPSMRGLPSARLGVPLEQVTVILQPSTKQRGRPSANERLSVFAFTHHSRTQFMKIRAILKILLATQALPLTALAAPTTGLFPDMPETFKVDSSSFNYVRRDVMIPMRDGVKLHTIIIIPKGAHDAGMLMTRTPYSADKMAARTSSGDEASSLQGYDNMPDVILDGGYIRVLQDVRGKYESEGRYVMNRPMRGPLNATSVDHSTDTWDTIEWLIHNVPESNGKVGVIGVSYDGYTALTALVHPHPALKVSVPMNPMVDGWMGDDWFHNGAFREEMLPYVYEQDGTPKNTVKWWSSQYDGYDLYLNGVSAGAVGKSRGMEQIGFFRALLAHPAYDSFWQAQAMDKILASEGLKVPTMLVHSLWDQEDIYGALATYYALHRSPASSANLYLVMGPWNHGGEIRAASTLGPVALRSDTGYYFRKNVLEPFLAHYLKDAATPLPARVTRFRTGDNVWETTDALPPAACASGCEALHFQANHGLGFSTPGADASPVNYVADPAHPVPYIPRPIRPKGVEGSPWPYWLATDQRNVTARTDVATFTSPVLTQPVTLRGEPLVHLTASTTGTDGDFVVKLIDVYPDEVADQREMGGYQFMVSADILRGRYRNGFDKPAAVPANTPQLYKFPLPMTNHTFLPGHRIMVQIQSSWFPLYDRNPQSYVDNIFLAPADSYKPATVSIDVKGSWIEVPVQK